jgi:hypothetical protein
VSSQRGDKLKDIAPYLQTIVALITIYEHFRPATIRVFKYKNNNERYTGQAYFIGRLALFNK